MRRQLTFSNSIQTHQFKLFKTKLPMFIYDVKNTYFMNVVHSNKGKGGGFVSNSE